MLVLLGNQWVESVPIFQVLVMAVFIGSFYRVTKWFYVSSGQTQRQLRWSLLHTPVVIAAAAIGAQWGPLGVAWGVTLSSLLLSFPAIAFCLANLSLSVRDFLAPIWRPATASIVTAVVLFLLQKAIAYPSQVFAELFLNSVLYGFLYLALLALLPGGKKDIQTLITQIQNVIVNRFGKQTSSRPKEKEHR